MKTRRVVFLAIAMFLLIGLFSPGSLTNAGPDMTMDQDNYQNIILDIISRQEGIPLKRLEMGDMVVRELKLTGVSFVQAKVVDLKTGEIYAAAVDLEGNIFDPEEVLGAEKAASATPRGRLEPALSSLTADMDAGQEVTVGIWLKVQDIRMPERPDIVQGEITMDMTADQWEGLRAEAQAAMQTAVSQAQAPVLEMLQGMGRVPEYVSPAAPLIFVTLNPEEISRMAERDDVDMIYGPNDYHDVMDIAKETQKAHIVDDWWGYDGTGIDLAILEDSRIEFTNPYLNAGTTRVPGDANVDDHATATGGMVASQHSTYQGIAQGVNLFSANATTYSDANISAAIDWAAVTQPMNIINNSWGSGAGTSLNVHARHLDYYVRHYPWATITVSAGNDGTTTEYVGNPGRAYNVITVGAYSDQGTITWDDDAMASYSSWKDPDTGAEKPEVAASGSSITSTTKSSPWTGNVGSGTSYSAPMVAGEAALMMDRKSFLIDYPETIKAAVMATALHNLEGSSQLSEYDGAGGVDMRRGVRLIDDGAHWWWNLSSADFDKDQYYTLRKGERIRAVIAWDSNPAADYSTDPLNADLDLRVYDPDGGFITSSLSYNNPFEIVEFTALKTGSYRFSIHNYRFDGTQEYVGMAIWAGDRKTAADFDEDYATEVSVYRPSNGNWYIYGASYQSWGLPGDRPVPADYDGDGKVDIAVYRPTNQKWYIMGIGNFKWGYSGDVPMPCDYNGDGYAEIAVYRPSNGNWYVYGMGYYSWGIPGDIPVPADYDGDGDCDITVYRPSNGKWYIRGASAVKWGNSTDIPVPGDYDGDGDEDIAVYRLSNGNWYIYGQSYQNWGLAGDVPVPGDYNGDGVTDPAVLRKSNGNWYIKGVGTFPWYALGDYPLPVRDTNSDGDPHN